jgi:Tfp pilus assembly PilM family ATPase
MIASGFPDLSKIFPHLTDDNPNEVFAAVQAIRRLLRKHGFDLKNDVRLVPLNDAAMRILKMARKRSKRPNSRVRSCISF